MRRILPPSQGGDRTNPHTSAASAKGWQRSAGMAGVSFALLYGAAIVLFRLSFPGDITARVDWVPSDAAMASTAVHLMAYAGMAFLWFMGVVRTRIGKREDRFSSTVFVGSGYLFLVMTFRASAMATASLRAFTQAGGRIAGIGGFELGARTAYELVNLFDAHGGCVHVLVGYDLPAYWRDAALVRRLVLLFFCAADDYAFLHAVGDDGVSNLGTCFQPLRASTRRGC